MEFEKRNTVTILELNLSRRAHICAYMLVLALFSCITIWTTIHCEQVCSFNRKPSSNAVMMPAPSFQKVWPRRMMESFSQFFTSLVLCVSRFDATRCEITVGHWSLTRWPCHGHKHHHRGLLIVFFAPSPQTLNSIWNLPKEAVRLRLSKATSTSDSDFSSVYSAHTPSLLRGKHHTLLSTQTHTLSHMPNQLYSLPQSAAHTEGPVRGCTSAITCAIFWCDI